MSRIFVRNPDQSGQFFTRAAVMFQLWVIEGLQKTGNGRDFKPWGEEGEKGLINNNKGGMDATM